MDVFNIYIFKSYRNKNWYIPIYFKKCLNNITITLLCNKTYKLS